ncbi:MAG: type II toxin-antitoxin system RelE/ParE family toxin [Daejeonella sp.]|nr:type II toxin-antitoxin system RelE/ParE family toxin [Daejeonella sp.]
MLIRKKHKVIYATGAVNDIREAKDWYNLQQKDLGNRFLNDVKSTILLVSEHPLSFTIKFGQIRMAICKVFPFAVHYEIDEATYLIRVISVFHFSRKPFWLKD